jgi:arginyl-tRNA--protein-N-Asp/Glu arginylyltransferase
MILLQEPRVSDYTPCTYMPDRMWRFIYFFASDIDGAELEELLCRGWRKFGDYYFRPACGDCRLCIPLRILAADMRPGKSQRRVMRRCANIEARFVEPEYRGEIFEIYRDHSMKRFGRASDEGDFIASFYTQSCPSLQSEYYADGELIAAGFLDVSREALSSAYFVYRTAYEHLRLGTYSVIREASHAASLGLKYYYLGYYIRECPRMEYKGHFHPHETYDWSGERWTRE